MEYGLIGEKLSHSYSKPIHALLGDYDYEIKSIAAGDLPAFFAKRDFKGINVTIPYKKTVIPFCDTLSPTAQRLGSVNTITRDKAGKLCGDNTDYFGFSYMAQKAEMSFAGKNVLVLGSGGTGITVEAVARDAGAANVTVVSRGGRVNYTNVYELNDTQIIVNATPVGMYPNTGDSPIAIERFPNCVGVLDVIYNPLFSRFLLEAKRLGIPFTNGLSMLAAQAKRSADLFFAGEITPKNSIDDIVTELTRRFTNIVLIGMPGCGKTSVGRIAAKQTDKVFTDTDLIIERETGMKIPDIFERFGEEHFRELEAAVIEKAGKEKGQVISTGGGAVLRVENYLNLKQNGVIVYVSRALDLLASKGRPLSADILAVERLYEKRLPLYTGYADYEVCNEDSAELTAQKMLEVLYENTCY